MIGSQQNHSFGRGIGVSPFNQDSAEILRHGVGPPELLFARMVQAPIIPAAGVCLCLALP